jgi:CheY-like chemotaxis protein
MDAVFAALACDESYLERSAGAEEVKPPARPWVLCIDDDSAFSLGLQMRLQEQGVDVLRAFAGREGYRCAFHSPAQAIILDYELPEGNGDYVLRRLKESPATRHIPVIVLTGLRDRHVERQMYSLGAASFMNKPYRWSELWEVLQRHLNLDGVGAREAPPLSWARCGPSLGGKQQMLLSSCSQSTMSRNWTRSDLIASSTSSLLRSDNRISSRTPYGRGCK